MTFSTLVFTYVFGGLTFVPLLIAAIVIPAWLLLPHVQDGVGRRQEVGQKDGVEGEKKEELATEVPEDVRTADAAASATFAVLREYSFTAALTALNSRNNNLGTTGGAGAVESVTEAGGSSESVYQSMYRSVFDRNKSSPTSRPVLESDDPSQSPNNKTKRKIPAVNIFYIVLRHGHLMLYDSASQMEVRHVIRLAHHKIVLSEGVGDGDVETNLKDGDLFIKRTSIVLVPNEVLLGMNHGQASAPKPFYLFTLNCSEKEDFYHALLYAQAYPPTPEVFKTNDAIKLQSTLHSTSLTPETRMLNALVGRIFLALYHTDYLKTWIRSKIEKKISRVQKPAFIAALDVKAIDLGDAAPVLSNPRLRDLNISGDMTIAFDLRYTGNLKLTFSALAKLDLGTRFKVRTVDLVLATFLQRLQGHVLIRIKPPPSNRIWFCFESIPDMDIRVEPVVSQRQITYTFILRAIEDRIRGVVGETLVHPNWDDVPFFDTRGQGVRGGIWKDEGGEPLLPVASELLAKNEKTMSMPVLGVSADDSSAASSGSEMASKRASGGYTSAIVNELPENLKRRSVASLPATAAGVSPDSRDATPSPSARMRPLRSPSLVAASAASVAVDESSANFDPARVDDSALHAQQARSWRMRPAPPPPSTRRDAVETMRQMRDRALASRDADDESDTVKGNLSEDALDAETDTCDINASTDSIPAMRSPGRTDTGMSTSTTSTTRSQQQRKTILAATAAATTAARNWSWNAIQNRTKGRGGGASQAQQAPLGRGQPLPPPGTPLPGPQKGLFGAALGTVKRKPVLPPRRPVPGQDQQSNGTNGKMPTDNVSDDDAAAVEEHGDDFGPWRENSGAGLEQDLATYSTDEHTAEPETIATEDVHPNAQSVAADAPESTAEPHLVEAKKAPPPLPARRKPVPSRSSTLESVSAAEPSAIESIQAEDGASHTESEEHPLVPSHVQPSETETETQSVPASETKFTQGEGVGEQDFAEQQVEQQPSHDEADDETDEGWSEVDLVAIPAPVDEGEGDAGHEDQAADDALASAEHNDAPGSSVEATTDEHEQQNVHELAQEEGQQALASHPSEESNAQHEQEPHPA